MATNVYESRQMIEFDPKKPSLYFGYYLSGSSDSMHVYPFSERGLKTKFEREVSLVLVNPLMGLGDRWRVPAFLAFSRWGHGESDQTWGFELLSEEMQDLEPDEEKRDLLLEKLDNIVEDAEL